MIDTLIFILLFVCQPLLWIFIINKYSRLEINILNPTIFFIFLFQYLGLGLTVLGWSPHDQTHLTDEKIVIKIFENSSIVIILIIVGYLSGERYLKNKINKGTKLILINQKLEKIILSTMFGISIIFLTLYISIIKIENVAIFNVLGIYDSVNFAKLRSGMTNNFPGKYHWFKLFIHEFIMIVAISLFIYFLKDKTRFKFLMFSFGFIIATFTLTMALEKSLFIQYLIGLFIAAYLIEKKQFLRKVSILGTAVVLISGILYLFFYNLENYMVALNHTLNRILISQWEGLYYYLKIFPSQINFLYGTSFPNPGGIFPWEPISISQLVALIVLGKSETIGSIPTFFWGEMYANFGTIGVFITPFFVGLVLFFVESVFRKFRFSAFVTSIYIWSILHYKDLAMTGLSSFVFDFYAFMVFSLIVIVLLINMKFS